LKAIILAAGKGSRLRPLTDNYPKCMMEFQGKTIINNILDTFKICGINDVIVVTGYKNEILEEHLKEYRIRFIHNKDYVTTNMVYSLFCAEKEMDDDLIISYADIVFTPKVLKLLIQNNGKFVVTIDEKWRELWESRMDDPLKDAETMKMDDNGIIVEIGKKPRSYDEIQGQYIGLFKISKSIMKNVRNFYHSLDESVYDDKHDYQNMYMTSFIQLVIERLMSVKAQIIQRGWLEFDTIEDYEKMKCLKL